MYHRILVPLDGSSLAEQALPHAAALAHCANGTIVLVRVVSYPLTSVISVDPTFSGTLADDLLKFRRQAESYLESTATKLRQAGSIVKTHVVDDASPAEAILDEAQNSNADVIVMSTHGRSGVSRWLLGSIADRVLRHAQVPVLLVRAAPTDIAG